MSTGNGVVSIALRHDRGPRVTALNISHGRRAAIAMFRSLEGVP